MASTKNQAHHTAATSDPALEAYFGAKLGATSTPRITRQALASQGLSDDTLFLTLEFADGRTQELVIRRYRSGGLLREETDPARQYNVLRALQHTSVPVPPVLWFEDDETILGGVFFVMGRVDGFVPVPWSREGRRFLARVGSGPIGAQFVRLLGEIHGLDWRALGLGFLGAPEPGSGFASARVDKLEQMLRRHQIDPEPIFEDAIGWLRENAPQAGRTALVHGDYRSGNLIYDDDRIASVLDWEFTQLGDPIMDVAWVCAPSNRMGSDLVNYLMPQERFLQLYEQHTGSAVSPAALRFWIIYHQCWHGTLWLSSAAAYVRGETTDLRLARMAYTLPVMRRMVADLLEYP